MNERGQDNMAASVPPLQHVFTLPNGIECEIREPGILALHALTRALPILTGEEKGDVATEVENCLDLVKRCSVRPQWSMKFPEECDDKEMSLDVLDLQNLGFLIAKILALTNVEKQKGDIAPLSPTARR